MYEFALFVLEVGNERGLDPNIVKPGWTALIIVALMGVILFFLCRSFLRVSKRANEPWPGDEAESPGTTEEETESA